MRRFNHEINVGSNYGQDLNVSILQISYHSTVVGSTHVYQIIN
jgi:hypothetical protein